MRKFTTDFIEDELSYVAGKKTAIHPGEELKRILLLSDERITNDMIAEATGVSRVSVNKLLNSITTLTTKMAVRLERAGLGSADKWLVIKNNYELSKIDRSKLKTKRIINNGV